MLQATLIDGVAFDLFPFSDDVPTSAPLAIAICFFHSMIRGRTLTSATLKDSVPSDFRNLRLPIIERKSFGIFR